MYPPGQILLIDADDTLWENNIYFEQAIEAFISWLRTGFPAAAALTPNSIREHLNQTERATIAAHGYGLGSFRRSMLRCMQDLTRSAARDADEQQIASFAAIIGEHELELLPDVAATLASLAARHRVLLVTKGDPTEQLAKLEVSGLAPYFRETEVLPEKHEEAYRMLARKHSCQAESTWMIGNSPKSDINPALAAGLNAVLIPHEYTWVLEHEPVDPAPTGQTLLEVAHFSDLLRSF